MSAVVVPYLSEAETAVVNDGNLGPGVTGVPNHWFPKTTRSGPDREKREGSVESYDDNRRLTDRDGSSDRWDEPANDRT